MNNHATIWKIKNNSTEEIIYSQNLNYVFGIMRENQLALYNAMGKPTKLPYHIYEVDINSVPRAELILYGDKSEST